MLHVEHRHVLVDHHLVRLCARYLLMETNGEKRARDPVAHFHLSNGARVEQSICLAIRGRRVPRRGRADGELPTRSAKIEDWHRGLCR